MMNVSILIFTVIVMILFVKDPYRLFPDVNMPPSTAYFMGTDALGRDVFSRILVGFGYSVSIMLIAIVIAIIIGVSVGLVCSLMPRVGHYVLAVVDFMNSLPSMIYMLLIASLVEASIWSLGVILGCCSWMMIARQTRIVLLKEKQEPYIQMALQLGTNKLHRIYKYYIPALYPVLSITIVHEALHIILAEATISFLGFGLPLNVPTLGNLLIEAQKYFLLGSWWNIVFPALAVMLLGLLLLKMKIILLKGGGENAHQTIQRLLRGTINRRQRRATYQAERQTTYNGQKWDW